MPPQHFEQFGWSGSESGVRARNHPIILKAGGGISRPNHIRKSPPCVAFLI
jgi:hypothetical protein